jgi:hypothetical protein
MFVWRLNITQPFKEPVIVNTTSTKWGTLPEREFRIFDNPYVRFFVFLVLAVNAVALLLLPSVLDSRRSLIMSGCCVPTELREQQATNVANFANALATEDHILWRARSTSGSGPLWELRVGSQGDLISVRDGKRTILRIPKFELTANKSWSGHPIFVSHGRNFAIEIIPETCEDNSGRYEGSAKIWITFKDPARPPLFGCAFLQRQSHDYSTKFYPISYN